MKPNLIKSQTQSSFYPQKNPHNIKLDFQDQINYLKKYNKNHWEKVLQQSNKLKTPQWNTQQAIKNAFSVKISKNRKMEKQENQRVIEELKELENWKGEKFYQQFLKNLPSQGEGENPKITKKQSEFRIIIQDFKEQD